MEKSYELRENYIINDFQINNCEFLCPECLQNALFGIKNKENKIYIKYKCRNEHNGEILIEDFIKEQKYSINNICCKNCGNLNYLNYCFECEISYCKNCESEHKKMNHNNITFKKEDFNEICPKHFKYYRVYCETCKLLLCEDCPTIHIKHNLSQKSIYFENELEKFKDKIKKIEKKRDDYIIKLEKKLINFRNKTQLQLQFIKSIMNSYNNKNSQFFNYEIYLNLKNLRLKELNFKEINEFLNKEYNIIDEYEININNNIENEDIDNR